MKTRHTFIYALAITIGLAGLVQAQSSTIVPPLRLYDEGARLPLRYKLNMVGSSVTCVDDAANQQSVCTFTGGGGGGGTVTSVAAGAGLSGGTITATGTISMPNTGPGATTTGGGSAYVNSVTTDAQGRITAIATGTPGSGVTIATNQIAYAQSTNTLGGTSTLTYTPTNATSAHVGPLSVATTGTSANGVGITFDASSDTNGHKWNIEAQGSAAPASNTVAGDLIWYDTTQSKVLLDLDTSGDLTPGNVSGNQTLGDTTRPWFGFVGQNTYNPNGTFVVKGNATASGTAIGVTIKDNQTLSTGDKIANFVNNTTEKFAVDYAGDLIWPSDFAMTYGGQTLNFSNTYHSIFPSSETTLLGGGPSNRFGGISSYQYDTKMGAQLTAASTITPTSALHHITGVTSITTIAATNLYQGNVEFTAISDSATITFATGGNIAISVTVALNKAQKFVYDASGTTWYPIQ